MNHAAQGKSAISSGEYESAIMSFTKAIQQNPQAPDYYIHRSIAYTRISPPNHEAAFVDAEHALALAEKRGKKEYIITAQLRRAIALFGLERWADSKQCLQWVRKLNSKEKSLEIWEMKVEGKLKGLEEGDGRAKVTVKENPDIEVSHLLKEETPKNDTVGNSKASSRSVPSISSPPIISSTQMIQTPADKIRSDWYQSPDTVTVTLMAKGIPKDRAQVKIHENSVEISFPLNSGSDFDFTLEPLFSEIDPDASSCKIMSTKAEFLLKKATPGVRWDSLEKTGPVSTSPNNSKETESSNGREKDAAGNIKSTTTGPAYPTSSKSGPKNWDKLAADLTTKPKKKSEDGSDDKAVEPADDDDERGDVDGFFQKLFKGADPDTKRAMMKSYQESNGTALSTNWAEVSQGPVETSPPEGMEAKKWGS